MWPESAHWTPKSEVFMGLSEKYHQKTEQNCWTIFQNENFTREVSWISRREFWQTCGKNHAKQLKKFRSVSQKKCSINQIFQKKNIFPKNCLWTSKLQLWHTYCKISTQRPIFPTQPKLFIKKWFYQKSFFTQTSSRQVKCNTLKKKLRQEKTSPSLQKYFAKNRKSSQKKCFSKKKSFKKDFFWRSRFYFDNNAEKPRRKKNVFWRESQNICSGECALLKSIHFSSEVPRQLN